ncbi:MAG: hypothetical protein IT405_00710 [Candidatus Yanofskybacteria bacterium]|nr:hypothetical protein [Candidatus Yanofskybacteria bacterium]
MGEFALPRDNEKYRWTHHVVRKLRFYGLTPSRVLRVIRAPERVEEGVAEGTLAAMQTAGTKAKPWEVWVMWREEKKRAKSPLSDYRKVIITAWRYPGVSPVRERVPLPAGVLAELESEGLLDA